jgi:hypothetical protein
VNARYAHPDPSLRIRSVTQRLYRGFCLDPGVLEETIQVFNSNKADMYTIIEGLPALTGSNRSKTLKFLDRFFDEAADEENMLGMFAKRCLD